MNSDSVFWEKRIIEHTQVINHLRENKKFLDDLQIIGDVIVRVFKKGNKLLVCGNGGSAADAQHMVAEMIGRFYMERSPLEAEALTVNTSVLTAIGNDYGYEEVFSRQVKAKGKKGDVLIGISTSGNSLNVIKAFHTAKGLGLITIGLTGGNKESKICKISDYYLAIPSIITPRIQEAHILILHMLCEYVEERLFGRKNRD